MQPPLSFQTTDVIYLQKIKCQYPKLYLKTTIAFEYIPDKHPKNIDKGSRRAIRFRGHKGTHRTPLPPMVQPLSRGSLSRLLSNATVKTIVEGLRRALVSPIPSKLQSHMLCSLEGYHHSITGMSPN